MPKAIVPICAIRYRDEQIFAIEAVEILYDAGLLDDDSHTSTVRVRVTHESDREEMRKALRRRLTCRDATRLINFLDAHDWDVAFFVDGRD